MRNALVINSLVSPSCRSTKAATISPRCCCLQASKTAHALGAYIGPSVRTYKVKYLRSVAQFKCHPTLEALYTMVEDEWTDLKLRVYNLKLDQADEADVTEVCC